MKHLLVISYDKFPNGNAGAVREHALAKIFMNLGYQVTVIGNGDPTDLQLREYDGIRYISFRRSPNTLFNRARNWLEFGKNLKNFLRKHSGEFTDFLFVNTYFLSVLDYIVRYAKKNGIRLFYDSVEWYSPEEFKLGKISPSYIKNNYINKHKITRDFKVIAISSYLERYFSSKGIDTLRIPVIMDAESLEYQKATLPGKTVISYAGRIGGKKDLVENIIRGILLLSEEEKERLEFRLIGARAEDVVKITNISADVLRKNEKTVRCFGRVARAQVLKNLQQTDFTVLIRDSRLRYAKAGFPTKVVESLMSGTPVICNLSSDLKNYLTDGENAVIAAGMDPADVAQAIRKAISYSDEKRKQMQKNARKTAEASFDYRNYIDIFRKWSK